MIAKEFFGAESTNPESG